METKKQERTEYVSIYVTPDLKKEFEAAKDNQALKESIIKNYLQSERNWLESELKEIDEATIKYSAKLIGIKEAFQKTQGAYIEEVEAIYKKANDTYNKLDTVSNEVSKDIQYLKENLSGLIKQLNAIDFHKAERMLEVINKLNNMTNSEREMLKKLLQ